MIEVEETHQLACDEDTFWSLYVDPAFQRDMLVDGLGYGEPDFVEVRDDGPKRTWKVVVTPKVDLPKAVARVLRGGMVYTETATVDPPGRCMSMRHETRALGSKLSMTGEARTRARADGGIDRITTFRVEARVLGVGKAIERSVVDNLRRSLDGTAAYVRRVLAAR